VPPDTAQERKIEIRAATVVDAQEIARLLTLLGHPTTESAIRKNWQEWAAAGNTAFVVPREDGTLAGVVTLHQMRVLHRPRVVGRITSLVVDLPQRGCGIGRALVEAAEEALARAGCGLLEITSNLRRADAHAFYERLGYARTSIRLAKSLVPA